MKLFAVDFEPMYQVGCCLIIKAINKEMAFDIAKKTITHTTVFEIEEIDMGESGIVIYMSGDY